MGAVLPANPKQPLIIAHRGSSSVAPENTLAAFARAIADGADGIEFDVQLARDGVPVVIHDANLRRTANRRDTINNLTSKELASIDVGSWFNRKYPRRAKPAYANEHIPTLEQVFSLVTSNARLDFLCYVELKVDQRDTAYECLVESVLSSIEAHGLSRKTTIASFNLAALAYAKLRKPSIRTGALFKPITLTPKRKHTIVARATECGATEILLHRLIARRGVIELALKSDLTPVVWTVDDPRWLQRGKRLDIHSLITNTPAKLLARMNR
jgi:glycerophosphoryl diester phosphodiesterase